MYLRRRIHVPCPLYKQSLQVLELEDDSAKL